MADSPKNGISLATVKASDLTSNYYETVIAWYPENTVFLCPACGSEGRLDSY
jgi:predicted RNA-binding Zn-ribbon protein involved in translation (DUF1610 family)